MLNEEKIKLMTSLAHFEKEEGRQVFSVTHSFRGDYIGMYLLRSFFGYTLCFGILFLLLAAAFSDAWMSVFSLSLFSAMLIRIFLLYLLGLIAYLVITWKIAGRRYDYAWKGLKLYTMKLKKLDRRYEQQGGDRP